MIEWRVGARGVTAHPIPIRAKPAEGRVNPFFTASTPRPRRAWSGLRLVNTPRRCDRSDRQEREDRFGDAKLPGPVLLTHDGARRRHQEPQRGGHAQRPADTGQLRSALRPGRPVWAACGGADLLRHRQRPRPLLFRAAARTWWPARWHPPRLELGNQDLVRAHAHSIWLAACSTST